MTEFSEFGWDFKSFCLAFMLENFGYLPGRVNLWSRHLLAISRGILGGETPIQLNIFASSVLVNCSMIPVYVSMGADVALSTRGLLARSTVYIHELGPSWENCTSCLLDFVDFALPHALNI